MSRHFRGRRRSLVRRTYDTIRAVDDVSFAIPRGACFAVVGESGCGKSTLARVLVGLLRPSAGEVRIGGEPLSRKTEPELRVLRRRVQLVLQDPLASLDPRMTVRAILREALVVHRLYPGPAAQAARIAAVLGQVGLGPEHLDRYPGQLSGGQRQRVAIARALACEPDILVLDEPVSALDVSVQAGIVNLLMRLRAELGLTFVVISHDLSLVAYMSDQVAVMYLGVVVELGPTREVCAAPLHPYSAGLLSAVAVPDPELEGGRTVSVLPGSVPSAAAVPPGCRFHPRCPRARAVAAGLPAAELASVPDGPVPARCAASAPALASPAPGAHLVACHYALVPGPA